MSGRSAIPGYAARVFAHEGVRHDVHVAGTGPAVVIVHGIPGIVPEVVRYAEWVRAAGFTVWLPSLFGTPMRARSRGYAVREISRACISREFAVLATDRQSPVATWLRALARDAFATCGGTGVGMVGMCLTGGLAYACALEPCVVASVAAQPSLPFPLGARRARALQLAPDEIAELRSVFASRGGLLALRFDGDPVCSRERFACLRDAFGDGVETIELAATDARPDGPTPAHGTLTESLDPRPGTPTMRVAERTIAFLRERLVDGSQSSMVTD